jgi:uncharacterized protein YijF (DUF1287 family)
MVRSALQSPVLLFALASVLTASAVGFGQSRNVELSAHQDFLLRLSDAALERTQHTIRYDPSYVRIPYPGGDVPADTGVCTDEVVRSYRALGIDLQKEVHKDMEQNLSAYPRRWSGPPGHMDTNIDHRRVPNLMVFFSRKGEVLAISTRAEDYAPGHLVTWDLGGYVPHIGIVTNRKAASSGRYMVVHNIGRGPILEDVLFRWKVTGHYRYFGPNP